MSKRRNGQEAPESQKQVFKRRKTEDSESEEESGDEEQNDSMGSMIEPVAGVILRVSLSNFMCHTRLEVPLGRHVNFIVGRNGSGKSAIVTALVVGLGGKASATNRGSSIKNFIKTKKHTAWVEVVLNNKGMEAYKPEVFGEKIIVRRKFSIDGSSSYTISSASGHPVSNRRDELSRITDHLNIQVDNPVSILNQDTSRNFLNTKSPGDKFKFFMKATQLEQMNSDYEMVLRNKEITQQDINSKKQVLPQMKSEVKVWENKFRSLEAISDLKTKVENLKNEMAWAEVIEMEKGQKSFEKTLHDEEKSLPRYVSKVEQQKAQEEECVAKHNEMKTKLIDCGKEVKDLEPLLQEKKKTLQQAKEKLAPILNQVKACQRELRNTQEERKQCQQRIEELKTVASHDYEADRCQREEQIKAMEESLEQIRARQKVKEHELDQYRSAVAKYKADIVQYEQQIRSKSRKVRDIRANAQTLREAKNDRLKRFGPYMPGVLNQIQKQKKQFHQLPIGPLGVCFDLADQKWALAIETCLKGLVSSFVCHDHHDEKLLEDIFNRSECPRNRRPTIITSAFIRSVHDVSRNKVHHERFPCLLDVIKCDHPVVINTLIDQRSVENVLLIEDSNDAREVMMRNPPRNGRECFTLAGDQVYSVPTFRYYSSDKTSVRFLMADVEDQISKLEQEGKALEDEIETITQQKVARDREIRKNLEEERKCQTNLNKAMEDISHITVEIRELQNVEDPAPVDVTTLEEEVETYSNKIQELEAKLNSLLEEQTKAEKDLKAAQHSYKKIEQDIRDRSDNGIQLRDRISRAQMDVEKAQVNHKHYRAKLKEQQRKIGEAKNKLEKHKQLVAEGQVKAQEICERIETTRTGNDIENEIVQTVRLIEEEEERHGNEEEVIETYRTKKEKLTTVQGEIKQLSNYIYKLDEVMGKRQSAYVKMRKYIANRIRYYFLIQMFQRSYTGKMTFDFTKQTLDILVDTGQDKKGKGGEVKDLKSLSGGERSFSTVCFILSVWEAMESPFRCLDEFDVFMDMVNRRISMDMMMETAQKHEDMQFIFLTPQDMSSVRKLRNVKIFRMEDPARSTNQQTLHFSQNSQQ